MWEMIIFNFKVLCKYLEEPMAADIVVEIRLKESENLKCLEFFFITNANVKKWKAQTGYVISDTLFKVIWTLLFVVL